MAANTQFRDFVLDQLSGLGDFETKNMFGGTAVLKNGSSFAKIKHGSLWLKVDDSNIGDFIRHGMPQYTYGKDNSRKLNFYETPSEVIEDVDALTEWATKACEAAQCSKQ